MSNLSVIDSIKNQSDINILESCIYTEAFKKSN